MDTLHREIIALIVRRRSALSLQQIAHGAIGYKSHLVEDAIASMIRSGYMTSMPDKGKTLYQLTLAGWNAYNGVVS